MLKNLLFFTCFAFSATLFSATVTWDGGAGSNNWSDANNWSGNALPGAGDDVVINIAATVSLSGINPSIKSLTVSHASASLTIASGVTLTISNNASSGDGINMPNGSIDNSGTISVTTTGTGTSPEANGIDMNNSSGTAMFTNQSGAQITINSNRKGILMEYSGITFNNSGTITVTSPGDDGLRINRSATFNNNSGGTINVTGGTDVGAALDRAGRFNNSGTLTISNCNRHGFEIFVRSSAPSDISRLDNLNGGILNISNTQLSSGSGNGLRVSTDGIVNNDGTLLANNNVTDISLESSTLTFNNTSNGIYSPGASPGDLDISAANFIFGSATYNFEINGTASGTQHDAISVTGTATVSNSATLNLIFGFAASVNQTFDIITAGSVSGTFGAANISNTGSGNVSTATLSYVGANTVRVTVSALLPVELTAFKVGQKNTEAHLYWQTASETNNEGFEVERSTNGAVWEKIGFVKGHGTSLEKHEYHFIDHQPFESINYYRLRQMDFDGTSDHSQTVSLRINQEKDGIYLFPNPTSGAVSLILETDYFGEAQLSFFDNSGKLVNTQTRYLEGRPTRLESDLSDLSPGVYQVVLKAGNERWVSRLMLE